MLLSSAQNYNKEEKTDVTIQGCLHTPAPTAYPSTYSIRQEATAWENHVQQADMSVPDFTRLATLDHRPTLSSSFFFHLQLKAKEESQEEEYKEMYG